MIARGQRRGRRPEPRRRTVVQPAQHDERAGLERRRRVRTAHTVGTMYLVCYLRDSDCVFETYWTNFRGVEAMDNSYALMDLTAYGRQEPLETRLPAGHDSESSTATNTAFGPTDARSPSGRESTLDVPTNCTPSRTEESARQPPIGGRRRPRRSLGVGHDRRHRADVDGAVGEQPVVHRDGGSLGRVRPGHGPLHRRRICGRDRARRLVVEDQGFPVGVDGERGKLAELAIQREHGVDVRDGPQPGPHDGPGVRLHLAAEPLGVTGRAASATAEQQRGQRGGDRCEQRARSTGHETDCPTPSPASRDGRTTASGRPRIRTRGSCRGERPAPRGRRRCTPRGRPMSPGRSSTTPDPAWCS